VFTEKCYQDKNNTLKESYSEIERNTAVDFWSCGF